MAGRFPWKSPKRWYEDFTDRRAVPQAATRSSETRDAENRPETSSIAIEPCSLPSAGVGAAYDHQQPAASYALPASLPVDARAEPVATQRAEQQNLVSASGQQAVCHPPIEELGRFIREVVMFEPRTAPRPEITPGSRPPRQPLSIIQTGSTFKSSIKLGSNASARQGNKIMGITRGHIEQRGSEFVGDIQESEGAALTQGNEMNGEMAQEQEVDEDEGSNGAVV